MAAAIVAIYTMSQNIAMQVKRPTPQYYIKEYALFICGRAWINNYIPRSCR